MPHAQTFIHLLNSSTTQYANYGATALLLVYHWTQGFQLLPLAAPLIRQNCYSLPHIEQEVASMMLGTGINLPDGSVAVPTAITLSLDLNHTRCGICS